MARIDFKWQEPKLNGYDGINPDDFRTALPDTMKQLDKPMLVFVTSDLADDEQDMKNIDSTVLKDESVSIGATLFTQIKFNASKIKESNPYWKTLGGKALPRMIVVDAMGEKVGSVEDKDISPSRVFALMKRAASKTYKTDLETVVKGTKSILTEIDQVEAKRKALETKKQASTVAKDAEWAKEAKELDEQMKAIETKESELKGKWTSEKKVTKA
jgi:hypothetical protein